MSRVAPVRTATSCPRMMHLSHVLALDPNALASPTTSTNAPTACPPAAPSCPPPRPPPRTHRPERLVSGSDDFTLCLYEPSVGKTPIARMTGHVQLINQVGVRGGQRQRGSRGRAEEAGQAGPLGIRILTPPTPLRWTLLPLP